MNLVEGLVHTTYLARASGIDPVAWLGARDVRSHRPDEAVARRVARLRTSLADGFAAGTAQELAARLDTADPELVRQLRGSGLPITYD